MLNHFQSCLHEPHLTCPMTTAELLKGAEVPMKVPEWPSQTQSVERCVKITPDVTSRIFSKERRDVYMYNKSQMISRAAKKNNQDK